jgi:hypothetical protein
MIVVRGFIADQPEPPAAAARSVCLSVAVDFGYTDPSKEDGKRRAI